ncbi:hypothetical protein ACFRIC_09955 [Streptomyces sp. NPDC056738]|uniref:hypothetical protein n=1 Tax=Streptomyces sp. NPDC056738 TaxID=3345933 RepID=UPI0036C6794E
MSEERRQLDSWAAMPSAFSGLKPEDFTIEVGERLENGDYDATYSVPAEKEWQIARLIMTLLWTPATCDSVRLSKTKDMVSITVRYPGYMADPNGKSQSVF